MNAGRTGSSETVYFDPTNSASTSAPFLVADFRLGSDST